MNIHGYKLKIKELKHDLAKEKIMPQKPYEVKSYYCLECRRKHIKGSNTYKNHMKYKK